MMLAVIMPNVGCFVRDYGSTVVASVAVTVATVSAILALLTFTKNARTRRAEFVLQLHNAFFVDSTFKRVRKIIDGNDEDDNEYRALVEDHDEDLIDFLNYFELIAYLEVSKNLSSKDVEALVGYYLRIVRTRPRLRGYVDENDHSFEHLQGLLGRLDL